MSGAVLLGGLCLVAFGYQGQLFAKRRALKRYSWDDLLARLEAVQNQERLAEIANQYLRPGPNQLRIEPIEMWLDVGGFEGLLRLYKNAEAMLDLAWYAERWNDVNGAVITEMMRRDAARLKKAVMLLSLTYLLTKGTKLVFHMQEAIASYYLMQGRLLGLYSDVHAGLLSRLTEAL